MGQSNKPHSFALLGGYRVRVTFRDGFSGEVDLRPIWARRRGPLDEPFQDPAFFAQAFLDHGVLTWPNSFDICPDVLRYYCELGRIPSREELKAHFDPEPVSSVLNDKPIT